MLLYSQAVAGPAGCLAVDVLQVQAVGTVLVGGVELKSSLYCRGAQNRSPEKRTVTRRTPES